MRNGERTIKKLDVQARFEWAVEVCSRSLTVEAQSILVHWLDMVEIEARISKCPGDTFAIPLRYTDVSGNVAPCGFNAILHLRNNAGGVVARKQESCGLRKQVFCICEATGSVAPGNVM